MRQDAHKNYRVSPTLGETMSVNFCLFSCRKRIDDENLYPIPLQVHHQDQSWHFQVNLDRNRQKFILDVNGKPFMSLPFASATPAQNSDAIVKGKVIVNGLVVHEGSMHWTGEEAFEEKYSNVMDSGQRITSLILDDVRFTSSRVSDEMLAFLAARVADGQLEEIRFKNSFGNVVTLEPSLIKSLQLNAAPSCRVFQYYDLFQSKRDKGLLLELCAGICSTSDCLIELNLYDAMPSVEQLQAIFEALLNNETSSLQNINLYSIRTLGGSQDLIKMLKLIIANQEKLTNLDLRQCGAHYPNPLTYWQQVEICGAFLKSRGAFDCEIKFVGDDIYGE